ncbi:MAG: hypothetical protein ACOX74_07530 [Lachnospiraceae bacterium]
MKSKIIGLFILLAAIAVGCVYYFGFASKPETVTINGYLGGEKTGLFEDEEFTSLMEKNYNLKIDYSKAGSLDMISADQTDCDYLFPSSQVALEMYRAQYGSPKRSEIIFNTPIVFYTHKAVADAFAQQGLIVDLGDGVKGVDMKALVQMIMEDKQWSDIGLSQLYGPVRIATTDPVRSNSGNMFAGLTANVMTESGLADESNVDAVLPDLKNFFEKSGYMESSSGDLFSQFLRTGIGAKPIIVGYESQILEFAAENPDDWASLKDDIEILYPVPTVWSSHPFIALDDDGAKAIDALLSDEVQQLAWTKHGFRTGVSGTEADISQFDVDGVPAVVQQVVSMPDAATMQKIIDALE